MGAESSKNIENLRNFKNRVTCFYTWKENIPDPKIINQEILTPFNLEEIYQMKTKKNIKDIKLDKFTLERKNILIDKVETVKLKRKIIEEDSNLISNIYRPDRFDFNPNMFHHENVFLFSKERQIPFVDISKKHFKFLEFKVIPNEITPLKIPILFEEIINQDICDMKFFDFMTNLYNEIELIASSTSKENLYKDILLKINEEDFYEKIIFLFTIEGFWYFEINEFLKKSNFESQAFNLNTDDIEIEYVFNEQVEYFKSNNKNKYDIYKSKYDDKDSLKMKSSKIIKSNKFIEELEYIKKYNKLENDDEFQNIVDSEELKNLYNKFNFNEEVKRKQEQKICKVKNEKRINEGIEDINFKENCNNSENNDYISYIDSSDDEEKYSENHLEKAIKKDLRNENENKSRKKKIINLNKTLEKIKYSYIAILAAISNYSVAENNSILTKEKLQMDSNGEKRNELKLYKSQLLSKDELNNIIMKKNQIRIHNEFISFYQNKSTADRFLEAKTKYSDKNDLIKVNFELKIPYFILEDYYFKLKTINENNLNNNIEISKSKKMIQTLISKPEIQNALISSNQIQDKNINIIKGSINNLSKNYSDIQKNLYKKSDKSIVNPRVNKISIYNKNKLEITSSIDENYFLNSISFMNTNMFSFFKNEEEILLNSGSVIIIDDVKQLKDSSWEIKASLINFSFLGFCHILPNLSNIEQLSLANNFLGKRESFAKILRKYFEYLKNLDILDISYNNFGENDNNGFSYVNKCLQENKKVKILNLKKNYFGKSKKNMKLLTEIINKPNNQIYNINISSNFLGQDDFVFGIFINALKKNNQLKVLDLSDNCLSFNLKSLMILTEYLNKNQQLIELDLSNNSLGEENKYARLISYAIMGSPSLLKVDLSSNNFGGNSNNNNNIINNSNNLNIFINKPINNYENELNDKFVCSIKYISEIFLFNRTIQQINLADNNIGINSVNCEILFKNLLMINSIEKINLSKNLLGSSEENLKYIRNFFIKNKKMLEIILDENEFFNNFTPLLISGIKNSNNFLKISLLNNNLESSNRFMKLLEKINKKKDFAEIII